jgi:PAS domain S-box-containing protein
MGDFFSNLFASDFMPHGHCFFWRPEILWLHVISDSLIALAYYSIPLTLWWYLRRRPGMKLGWLILMFAGFILACGTTHLMAIWDLWNSAYRLEGVVKAVTAAISIAAAAVSLKLAPQAVRIPTPDELAHMNRMLQSEVEARKEAERQLRELLESQRLASEEKLRAFFEAAPQAIVAMSRDGRIRLVNRRAEEMFGRGREELLGQPAEILMPERFHAAHRAGRERFFQHPHTRIAGVEAKLMGLRADGAEFPVEISISYVQQPEEALALALVTDVTERRRIEDALRESESRFRALVNASAEIVWTTDADGSVTEDSPSWSAFTGQSQQQRRGFGWLEAIHPEDRGSVAEWWGRTVEERAPANTEYRLRHGSGEWRTTAVRAVPLLDAEGAVKGWVGMNVDITDRKKAEQEAARVNAELRRSNQELEHFSYAASHDLQEPLRMITNYLQLLEKRGAGRLNGEDLEFLHYATDGAQRLKALIQDLLRLARAGTQPLKLTPVAAASVLETARVSLSAAIEESGAAVTAGELPHIVADGNLLAQVLQNLIGNAIKFQKPGTRPEVHVSAWRHGPDWVFAVRDNGIGIEARHLERVFKMFERLHGAEDFAGSGVGLAIAQRIVERHGGRIWVESTPGRGSTFYFTVPAEARGSARTAGRA